MPRDPKIQNLQVEIYISTKRRQNPMEFRWFRDRFLIFQKCRVGPTLITRLIVYIFIYIRRAFGPWRGEIMAINPFNPLRGCLTPPLTPPWDGPGAKSCCVVA